MSQEGLLCNLFNGFSSDGDKKNECIEAAGKLSLPMLGALQRRRNLDDFVAGAVAAIVAAVVSPTSLVKLLEGEYLDGFKILDTESFIDAHLWSGWHFLRRRIAASLTPGGDCCEVVVTSFAGPGEECLRVYVADRLHSKSARSLRLGLR